MSRLSRLGSDTPVYFPSIVSNAGNDEKKFTPIPPQRNSSNRHPKKVHANDYRVHLEPLKPLRGLTSGVSIESIPPSERRPQSSSGEDGVSINCDLEKQLRFYRQLANVRLRDVTDSEESLLKTIDELLAATTDALGADWAVLYALDDQARLLNVTACTKPEVVGFEVPLEKFSMDMVVTNVLDQQQVTGGPKLHKQNHESTYVENIYFVDGFDISSDVDCKTGVQSRSVLASAILDESGKPIFVVEARSLREMVFPTAIFAAAVTSLENIVYQYDVKQIFSRTRDAYNLLEQFLQHTIHPEIDDNADCDKSTSTPDDSTHPPRDRPSDNGRDKEPALASQDEEDDEEDDVDEEVAAANREELRWLVSPRLNHLVQALLNHSRSDAVTLLEFHPIKKQCGVLASSTRGVGISGTRELRPETIDALKSLGEIKDKESHCDDSSTNLFERLVASVDGLLPLDLSNEVELQNILANLSPKTIVFLPLPRSMSASYAGILCVSSQGQCRYDVHGLKPFLASLALAVVLKKKNEDMITSSSQKKKLINLFNSHFQVENMNDPSALVNLICDIGQDIFHTKRVTLYVADQIKSELWSLSTLGSVNGIRIPYGKGIAGTVAYTKEALIVRNPYEDPRFDRSFDIKFGFKTESLITFPILDKNGDTLGVIQAVNSRNFLDTGSHPLIRKFDEKVLDVYSHLVSHALRINSSLIMFAKVQADYWANRVVLDIHDDEDSSAKHDVASVHSLLDISGFDEAKRVPRNKWSTFAYACLALGKFLAKCFWKRKRDMERRADALAAGRLKVDAAHIDVEAAVAETNARVRTRKSVAREELLSDNFDALSKSIDQLKGYSFQLFEGLLMISTFRIPEEALHRFIDRLANKYRNIPYHSFYHGFDVAHSSYRLIRETSVLNVIKEFEALSLIVASLGHDADHPGNDNQFEVDSGSHLALCYNDVSVLENHHAATTFTVLRTPGCDILRDLSSSMKTSIRTAIIRCILATDMKHHSKLLGDLACVSKVEDFQTVTDGRQLMLNMVIHGGDLGSVARPLVITRRWVDLVCEEFSQQASKSEQLGVFIPPHIINLHDDAVKSRLQVNFIDYLVAPLWNAIASILPEAKKYVDNLRANREFYFEHAGQMSARRATSMPQH